jgi:hypothetical protein
MIRIIFGIFIVLHGLVHLLYLGQSTRIFELQPGMVWPEGAWAFTKLFGNETTRSIANILLILAAVVFIVGGAGVLFKQDWWRAVVVSGAVFSAVTYLILWDGRLARLADHGWVGILIDLAIAVALLLFKWQKI